MTASQKPLASLPMYDWPEVAGSTDAFWTALRTALAANGIEAPTSLGRTSSNDTTWRDPGLVLSQTCGWPLVTRYRDTLHVVARPVYTVEGCGDGTYRSAIVARRDEPLEALVRGTVAVNGFDSLSGYRTLAAYLAKNGIGRADASAFLETGSHRASIQAVAEGRADVAAIDCVSWRLALDHEPAARSLAVVGWTEELPVLPFVTSKANVPRASAIFAALETTAERSPQPHLTGVIPASLDDYDAVVALGERVRAAGF